MDKNTALDELTTANGSFMLAEIARDTAAYEARAAGATWNEIGLILGITKQRAQQRYADPKGAERTARLTAAAERGKQEAEQFLAEMAHKHHGAALPEASKIIATDVAGPSVTPSIFLEPAAPAKAWTPPEGSPLHSYDNRETSDWYITYGCGECGRNDRPADCPNCHERTKEGTK